MGRIQSSRADGLNILWHLHYLVSLISAFKRLGCPKEGIWWKRRHRLCLIGRTFPSRCFHCVCVFVVTSFIKHNAPSRRAGTSAVIFYKREICAGRQEKEEQRVEISQFLSYYTYILLNPYMGKGRRKRWANDRLQ